ncbi:MAG: hypothetical protein ACOH1N_08600 [Lutibacter sp.]
MCNIYSNIICIHPKDSSTDFLRLLGEIFNANYIVIDDNDEAHTNTLLLLESFREKSLVVFLGHGHTYGLSSSNTNDYPLKIFIDIQLANKLFIKHDVLLLACRSSDFIRNINPVYSSIIGFGNILSSLEEVSNEAQYETGLFRDLNQVDIDDFNNNYIDSISKSLKLLFENKIIFSQIPIYISYFLNKKINNILRKKEKVNRIEVAKLLFELRDEMIIK